MLGMTNSFIRYANMADVENTERICRAFIETIAKENGYDSDFKVIPISTDGANYTSHLFITTLTKREETVNLFAKVAAVGEKLRAQNPIRIYETEIYFYTKIVKIYHDLEEKNNVPEELRIRVSKFYGYNPKVYEETLVFENLTTKGFTTHDRLKTVDWEYAAASLTELGKFHALSIAYQETDPERFEEVKEKLKIDLAQKNQNQTFFESVVKNALSVTKEENREKLKMFLEDNLMNYESFIKFYQPQKRSVITHGDYRPSNLMHRQVKDGSLEVIPVDFQTALVGSPISDLLYFIFSATDEEFRKEHYQRMINHYYDQLGAALKRLGLDPEVIYSREDFDAELKEKMPYGLCIAVFVLPIVTVDAKNAPKVDKDMELASFSVQVNGEQFPKRFNGVVDDYVRWGLL